MRIKGIIDDKLVSEFKVALTDIIQEAVRGNCAAGTTMDPDFKENIKCIYQTLRPLAISPFDWMDGFPWCEGCSRPMEHCVCDNLCPSCDKWECECICQECGSPDKYCICICAECRLPWTSCKCHILDRLNDDNKKKYFSIMNAYENTFNRDYFIKAVDYLRSFE